MQQVPAAKRSTAVLCFIAALGLAALVLGVGVADLVTRSRAVTYNVDEIANVDAIYNFLSTGDYTSARFGGVPFDPFISSGVLATWSHGIALTLGESLFVARVASGLLVLMATVLLIFGFLRSKGFASSTSLLVASGVWLVQSVLPIHRDQLIMNSGEIWAFLYLFVGLVLADKAPRLAAFFWGLSTWLCKFVYLPFALAFLLAGAGAELDRCGDRRVSRFVRLALPRFGAFLLPLVLWMVVIAVRYGPMALPAWIERYLFVIRYHADGNMWGNPKAFMDGPTTLLLTTFLALAAGPLALLAHAWLRPHHDRRQASHWMLTAGAGVALIVTVWFVAFDVTQNARHILPAMYVSTGIAVYCAADVWSAARQRRPALAPAAGALALIVLAWTCVTLIGYRVEQNWRMSYAEACRGPALLVPPCQQDRALWLNYAAESELRWPSGRCDNECFAAFKQRIFGHARRLMDEGAAEAELYTAAYLMLLLQQNRLYQDESGYARDVEPILCAAGSGVYRHYLAEAGLDVAGIVSRCEAGM